MRREVRQSAWEAQQQSLSSVNTLTHLLEILERHVGGEVDG